MESIVFLVFFFSSTCFLGQLNVLQMSEKLSLLIVIIGFKESKHNLYPQLSAGEEAKWLSESINS